MPCHLPLSPPPATLLAPSERPRTRSCSRGGHLLPLCTVYTKPLRHPSCCCSASAGVCPQGGPVSGRHQAVPRGGFPDALPHLRHLSAPALLRSPGGLHSALYTGLQVASPLTILLLEPCRSAPTSRPRQPSSRRWCSPTVRTLARPSSLSRRASAAGNSMPPSPAKATL